MKVILFNPVSFEQLTITLGSAGQLLPYDPAGDAGMDGVQEQFRSKPKMEKKNVVNKCLHRKVGRNLKGSR